MSMVITLVVVLNLYIRRISILYLLESKLNGAGINKNTFIISRLATRMPSSILSYVVHMQEIN